MAKKKKKKGWILCKKCDYFFEHASEEGKKAVKKTWTKVAPMPDKEGNVTIVAMATYNCPSCGKNIMASFGKSKGEFDGKSRKTQIEEKLASGESFNIDEFAEEMKSTPENLLKMLNFMIKKKIASGKIISGEYKA